MSFNIPLGSVGKEPALEPHSLKSPELNYQKKHDTVI